MIVDEKSLSDDTMKKKDFENDLEEAGREPIFRKRNRAFSFEEDDYAQRNLKKSGKRSHRKLTPKDSFGEE